MSFGLVGACWGLSGLVGSCREFVGACRNLSGVVGSCRELSELVGSLSGVVGNVDFMESHFEGIAIVVNKMLAEFPIPEILRSVPGKRFVGHLYLPTAHLFALARRSISDQP